MESSLKHVLDYKLLFDILADSNGLVKLQTLEASWPSDLSTPMLPRGCVEFWREYSTSDGYLDWEMFSGGLEKALKADSFRLSKKEPPTEAELRLKALRSEVAPLSKVKAADIEGFLASCKADALVQALVRTRKEVFRCQTSLHTLTSPTATNLMRRNGTFDPAHKPSSENKRPTAAEKKLSGPTVRTNLSLSQEKEELIKGLEVLESTRQWFSDRIEQVSLEEKQLHGHSREMRAEELLAALEQGGEQSETVRHIKEINSHLKLLAMEATATGHTNGVVVPQLPRSGKAVMKSGRVGLASSVPTTPTTSPLVSVQHRHQVTRSHSSPSSIPIAVVEIPNRPYSTTQTPPTRKVPGTSAERSQQPATMEQPRPRRKHRPRRSQSLTEGINVEHLYPQSFPQQSPLRATPFTGSVRELQHPASVSPSHRSMSMKNISHSVTSPAQTYHPTTSLRQGHISEYPGHRQHLQPPHHTSTSYSPRQKKAVQNQVSLSTENVSRPPNDADRKRPKKVVGEHQTKKSGSTEAVLEHKMLQHRATVYPPADETLLSVV